MSEMEHETFKYREDAIESTTVSKKEYYKLLDKYQDIEGKIRQKNKEKAVSVVSMQILNEAEQTKELVKERLKQLGKLMLLQQQNVTNTIINRCLQMSMNYIQSIHRFYSTGVEKTSSQLSQFEQLNDYIEQISYKIEANKNKIETTFLELGSGEKFNDIIKKKKNRDQESFKQNAKASSVLHHVIHEGTLEMAKTLLDNNSNEIDIQDHLGF